MTVMSRLHFQIFKHSEKNIRSILIWISAKKLGNSCFNPMLFIPEFYIKILSKPTFFSSEPPKNKRNFNLIYCNFSMI